MQEHRAKKDIGEQQTKQARDQIPALLDPLKQATLKDFVEKSPPEIQAVIAKPAAERNPFEWQMFYKLKPYLSVDDDTAANSLKGAAKTKYQTLATELKKSSSLDPGLEPLGIGMRDVDNRSPVTHRLGSGVWGNPGVEV